MPDQHEALLRRYIHEVWDEGNPDAAAEFLDESYVRHVSPTQPALRRAEQIDLLNHFLWRVGASATLA